MYHNLLLSPLDFPAADDFLSNIERYTAPRGEAFLCQCEFYITQFDVETAEKLNIAVPDSIKQSVKKRQAEFIAGRYMVKLCLEALSVDDHNVAIGSHREPLWPKELIGAISHTSDRVVALVAERVAYQFVGIDTENWLDSEGAEQICSYVHDKDEFALLREQGLNSCMATSIIFSAKESLFKATFPYIGHYFGFESARVMEFNLSEQSLELVLDSSLSWYCLGKRVFKCRYFIGTLSVTTVILS